jgi:hypothetical protein
MLPVFAPQPTFIRNDRKVCAEWNLTIRTRLLLNGPVAATSAPTKTTLDGLCEIYSLPSEEFFRSPAPA